MQGRAAGVGPNPIGLDLRDFPYPHHHHNWYLRHHFRPIFHQNEPFPRSLVSPKRFPAYGIGMKRGIAMMAMVLGAGIALPAFAGLGVQMPPIPLPAVESVHNWAYDRTSTGAEIGSLGFGFGLESSRPSVAFDANTALALDELLAQLGQNTLPGSGASNRNFASPDANFAAAGGQVTEAFPDVTGTTVIPLPSSAVLAAVGLGFLGTSRRR